MKKIRYGKRSSGKVVHNGGFSGQPTVTYTNITDEQWANIDWSDYKKDKVDASSK